MDLSEVRYYFGSYSGGLIKPVEGEDISRFKDGDHVVVFNAQDFYNFYKENSNLLKTIYDELSKIEKELNE